MGVSPKIEFARSNPITDVGAALEALSEHNNLAAAASLAQSTAERITGELRDETALLRLRCGRLLGQNVLLHAQEAFQLSIKDGQKLWFPLAPNHSEGIRLAGYLYDIDVFDRFQIQGGDELDINEANRLAVSLELSPNVLEHVDFEVHNLTYVPANTVTHSELLGKEFYSANQ